MSTAIGQRMINGSGITYHRGNGIGRTIASEAFKSLANAVSNAVVGKVAEKIKGSGVRITGEGAITGGKRRVGRPRKVGRPKKH